MKVDRVSNSVTPAGEVPAKTIEDAKNIPTSDFFAEIDRALNMGNTEANPGEIKILEQTFETPDNNDLSLFISACLFALQPVHADPNLNLSSSGFLCESEDVSERVHPKDQKQSDGAVEFNKVALFKENGNKINSESNPDVFDRVLFDLLPAQIPGIQRAEPKAIVSGLEKTTNGNAMKIDNILSKGIINVIPQDNPDPSIPASLNLQDVDSRVESISLDSSDKYEMKTMSLPDNKSIQPKPIVKEGIYERTADNAVVLPLDANKQKSVMPVLSENTCQETTSRIQDSSAPTSFKSMSKAMSAGVSEIHSPKNGKVMDEIMEKLNPSEATIFKETNTASPQTDKVTAVSRIAEGMALNSKSDGSPESAKTKNPISEQSQEKFASMVPGMERSTETNNSISSPDAAAPSRSEELIHKLAERIQVQLRDGKGEIRIQLKPDNLGSLEIRAESGSNGVIARITAESGSVKNYLENNLNLLQQSLQDQGLKIDRIQVNIQDALDSQSTSGQSTQFGHAGSGNNHDESTQHNRSTGFENVNPTEELSVDSLNNIFGISSRFYTVA